MEAKRLEQQVKAAKKEIPENDNVLMTLDDKDSNTESGFTRLKKLSAGRYCKALGDVFLLLGDLSKSTSFLESAIKMTRSNNDHLWLAGALESSAASILHTSGLNIQTKYQACFTWLREAVDLYARGKLGELQIEALFKLLDLLITYKEGLSIASHNVGKRGGGLDLPPHER